MYYISSYNWLTMLSDSGVATLNHLLSFMHLLTKCFLVLSDINNI